MNNKYLVFHFHSFIEPTQKRHSLSDAFGNLRTVTIHSFAIRSTYTLWPLVHEDPLASTHCSHRGRNVQNAATPRP